MDVKRFKHLKPHSEPTEEIPGLLVDTAPPKANDPTTEPVLTVAPPTEIDVPTPTTPPTPKSQGLKPYHELADGSELVAPMHRTGPAVIGTTLSLVLLTGLSVVWFNMHQSVYTLGLPGKQSTHNTVASTSSAPSKSKPTTLGAETSQLNLNLTLSNLQPLTQAHYQAWLIQGDKTTSIGGFNPASSGPILGLDGTAFNPAVPIDGTNAQLIITIEAGSNVVTTPSKSIILSGTLKDNKANLTFNAIDLSTAKGVYSLATATDPNGPNQKSGIWFAHSDGKTLTGPGLDIPDAPVGWKYEAQAMFRGVAVAMGRFSKKDQTDEFNKYAINQDQLPTFPGEDFLQKAPGTISATFPTDLTTGEWSIIISLEPDQNNVDPTGDGTFFLQPIKGTIDKGASTYKEYPLTIDLKNFPTGKAELK
jgi:hypothetical protein